MTEPNDPGQRERRATDGLDWRPSQPAAPAPDSAPVAPAPRPAPAPAPPAPRRSGVALPLVAAIAGIAALLGGLMAAVAVLAFSDDDGDTTDAAATSVAGGPQVTSIEQTSAITEVANRVRPAVIRLESTRTGENGRTEQDIGSGVLLDREGHVLTNAHVVLGTETLKAVLADGTERPAILVGHDFPFTDLAVVQIGPANIAPVDVGDSGSLALGQTVVALGNPLAEFAGSVTVGIVSGLNRSRVFDGVMQSDLIQTDAAINSGNSGGALLNLNGQFVGMPTSVIRETRGGAPVEGIAFALPSNRIMEVARAIIANGGSPARPSIQADHLDLTPDVVARTPRLAVDRGALVTAVRPGGAADVAGVQAGDVITKVGDDEINDQLPLLNALIQFEPGTKVPVVLNRGGRIIETEIQLEKRG